MIGANDCETGIWFSEAKLMIRCPALIPSPIAFRAPDASLSNLPHQIR
jgi:hypothetical protein